MQREVGFLQWVGHLQNAYFGQKSIPSWTLEDDGGNPPRYPNAVQEPTGANLTDRSFRPQDDPQRGPRVRGTRPGQPMARSTTRFEWVELGSSLQWRAFQRVLATLEDRGNDVLVVLGPFNEHMLSEDNRPAYRKIRDGIVAWLGKTRFPRSFQRHCPASCMPTPATR